MLQVQFLRDALQRTGFWPQPGYQSDWQPDEMRREIISQMRTLQGPYLQALFWITSALMLLQMQAQWAANPAPQMPRSASLRTGVGPPTSAAAAAQSAA